MGRAQSHGGISSQAYPPLEYLVAHSHGYCRQSCLNLLIANYKKVDKDGTLDVSTVLSAGTIYRDPEAFKNVIAADDRHSLRPLTKKNICYLIESGYLSVVLNRYAQGRITEEALIKNDTSCWDGGFNPFITVVEKYMAIMGCMEVQDLKMEDLSRNMALEINSLKELLKIFVNQGVDILKKDSSEVNKLLHSILSSQRRCETKCRKRVLDNLIVLLSQHSDFWKMIDESYNGETLRTWVYKYGLPETVALLSRF